jgi:hypothetical protein
MFGSYSSKLNVLEEQCTEHSLHGLGSVRKDTDVVGVTVHANRFGCNAHYAAEKVFCSDGYK